jgi:ankyrin repeat protein
MDIFEAIKERDSAKVQEVLRDRPDSINQVSPEGNRPVLFALYSGQLELAMSLRKQMDSINLWEAAALGEVESLHQAVEKGQAINDLAPDGFTALGLAAFFGRIEALAWLLANSADPNISADNQMKVRPIHSAAAHRDAEVSLQMVKALIEVGAEVNVAQHGGWTPLHQAADHGHHEQVQLLLDAGADPGLKSMDGRVPADMAREKSFNQLAELLAF